MKYSSVKREIPPVFFTPHRQSRDLSTMYFYVRTASDPSTMLRSMASVVQRLDPMLPVENLRTMPEEIRLNTFEDRMITTLAASFALLATLLASIGLYGVLAYSVAQRTREIGVRMALGARAEDVVGLVLREGLASAMAGIALGTVGALALSRAISSMLFGVKAVDPPTFLAVAALLSAVAMLACYLPARKATRVDPMSALRSE